MHQHSRIRRHKLNSRNDAYEIIACFPAHLSSLRAITAIPQRRPAVVICYHCASRSRIVSSATFTNEIEQSRSSTKSALFSYWKKTFSFLPLITIVQSVLYATFRTKKSPCFILLRAIVPPIHFQWTEQLCRLLII